MYDLDTGTIIGILILGIAIWTLIIYLIIREAVRPLIKNSEKTKRLVRMIAEKHGVDQGLIDSEMKRVDDH